MAGMQTLIAQANRRDVDATLALMTEDVSWPTASEGGRVAGKEAICACWTRQWKEFDPHVEPIQIIDLDGAKAEVRGHKLSAIARMFTTIFDLAPPVTTAILPP